MHQEPGVPQPDTRVRFLRVVGTIWLVVMVLTLGGAVLAPYLGHIADIVLHQTVHRQWARPCCGLEPTTRRPGAWKSS